MSEEVSYKQYSKCIRDILTSTFADKKICLSFWISLIVLIVGVFSHLALPLFLKKIVDSFPFETPLLITITLLSYGLMWMISQVSVQVRTMLIFKIEQRLTFVLGSKVLSHIFGLSLNYLINQQPGALTNIIRRAQQNVPQLVLGLFFTFFPPSLNSYLSLPLFPLCILLCIVF